jgi:hypothetical protein
MARKDNRHMLLRVVLVVVLLAGVLLYLSMCKGMSLGDILNDMSEHSPGAQRGRVLDGLTD